MSSHNIHPHGHHHDEHVDLLEGLQNIPSHINLLQTGAPKSKPRYLSPKPKDTEELQDPEHFGRLSVSSVSSYGNPSRGTSPYPGDIDHVTSTTWRSKMIDFWDRNQGLFLVTISQLFGALMNVTTRLLELEGDGMEPFQILFARQGLTAVLCTIWMWWRKVPEFPLGAKNMRLLLVARATSGFFGIYGMYYSLQYLPVADAVVITFLSPSVAGYACYVFLREPFPRSSQYASLVSLIGVILIARPTSFFTSSSTPNTPPTPAVNITATATATSDPYYTFPEATPTQRLNAILLALLGVLGSAGAFTSIRHLGTKCHPLISVNYFSTFCTLISFLALVLPFPISQEFKLPANLRQWSMLLFLGVCGFTMQFLLTKGLAGGGKGETRGMNMIYTNMLFAMGLDRVVFGVVPGVWSLLGGGIVLGSAVYIAMQGKAGGGREARRTDVESGSGGVQMRASEGEHGDEAERRRMLDTDHDEHVEGNVDESDFALQGSESSSNNSSSTIHEYGARRGSA